jgi:hypothetical protein
VKYGEYDIAKVVESAREVTESFGVETFLGFDISGVYALEEMLLARYHMHRQVYGHRTRVATDRMLVRAINLALEEGLLPADVFTPPKDANEDFVTEYVAWDDSKVFETLLSSKESPAGKVMNALVSRRLFKRVLEYDFPMLEEKFSQPEAGYIAEPTDEKVFLEHLPEAEDIIAQAIGVPPYWVSLHWIHVSNPISSRFSFKVEGKKILILDGDRRREFNEISEVFSPSELPGQLRIALYARLPNDKSKSELDTNALDGIESAMNEALTVMGRVSAES